MTQLEYAKNNRITPLMKKIAVEEALSPKEILKYIKEGRVVILKNSGHSLKRPCAVGYRLRTKVNANIGTSSDQPQIKKEIEKLRVALAHKADTIMDLSTADGLKETRKEVLKHSDVPVGTVPIYEIAVNAQKKYNNFLKFSADETMEIIESQAQEGVDFFTIHSGINKESLAALKKHRRILDIVSRGGAIIASWMHQHKKENPFYEHFDRILEIAVKYDVTLSLGDGLRPGSISDATDKAQIAELKILGRLALRAREKNVQVIIEGPGHIPLDQIQKNIALEKKFCYQAPFYVLGPLVTDVACGYDHINASIGAALAAGFGADFLCYVTASEHLRHPSVEDVKEGVVASRISAHAADIVKKIKSALLWDKQMSLARRKRDWKTQIALSIDPDKAKRYRNSSKPHLKDVCTMCGKYCSIKLMQECLS
jgi:phosphomethylpyrimidine synthase